MTSYSVCIPSNGTGQRFNNELPKQFVQIKERPLIYHTVSAFVNCSLQLSEFKLNEIVISCSAEFEDYIRERVVRPLTEQSNWLRITLVRGGKVRHESICSCLHYLTGLRRVRESADHVVLVHDAVRPLVEADLVKKLIKNALAFGASGPVCNLSSTILKADQDGFMDCALNRSEYKASEMPQAFRLNSICDAYLAASSADILFGTECLDLIRRYTDCRIKLIPADANSLFKVTFRKDYFSALGMIRRRLTYQSRLLNDAAKANLDLIKFNANLKSTNLNGLDVDQIEFEESQLNECDILFAFNMTLKCDANKPLRSAGHVFSAESMALDNLGASYGHIILIHMFLDESEKRELMSNCDQLFRSSSRMTLLLSSASNPINNLALYDKIRLICSNTKAMLGQLIQV